MITQKNDFIMLPTNDVCFTGLMENPIVRKGFCVAIMRISPEEIKETELLPTHLHPEFADDKLIQKPVCSIMIRWNCRF